MKRIAFTLIAAITLSFFSFAIAVAEDEEVSLKLKISADYLVRSEMRSNSDLNSATSDHKDFTGQRIRVNLGGSSDDVDYFLQILDGRDWGNEKSTGATADDSLDLLQGYLEFGDKYRLRIGRQEITYGKKRLIGSSGWSYKNLPAFDGMRVFYKVDDHRMDTFVAKVAENSTTTNDDVTLYGASWTWEGGENWEPGFYALYEHDEDDPTSASNDGSKILSISSIGTWNIVEPLLFDWELILQDGNTGGLDHKAHFYHLGLKYTDPVAKKYFIATEYNYATGDDNSADNRNEVFDKQYGINHSYYGYIDYQNPQNMKHLRLSAGGSLNPNTTLQADYHIFKLAEATDKWQGRNYSGVSLKDATGASGSDAGTELDFTLKMKCRRGIDLEAGYAWYFTGSFIENVLGTNASNSNWGYIMMKKSFK